MAGGKGGGKKTGKGNEPESNTYQRAADIAKHLEKQAEEREKEDK